jgi:hypothetical protein
LAVAISFLGLLMILTFALRATSLASAYGVVPAELPVVAASVDDPAEHRFRESPHAAVSKLTPAVVLTTEAFFFGDLAAFTTNFSDTRDKFMIRHVDGEPQLQLLIDTMEQWAQDRQKSANVPLDKVLVFVPAGDIPMPIVIQVLAGLRKAPHFSRVVMGSGII